MRVPVIYHSRTGKTKALAQEYHAALAPLLPPDMKVELIEASTVPDHRVFLDSPGFVIGSPDYFSHVAGHVKNFFDDTWESRSRLKGRPVLCFVTHGGGGKAAPVLESLCKAVGLRVVQPTTSLEHLVDQDVRDVIKTVCKAFAALLT